MLCSVGQRGQHGMSFLHTMSSDTCILHLAYLISSQPTSHRTFSLPPVPRLLKADSPPFPHRLKEKASVEASIIITRIASILPPHTAARAPGVLLLEPCTMIELEQCQCRTRAAEPSIWLCIAEGMVLAPIQEAQHSTR